MVSIAQSTQDVGLGLGRRVHGLVKDVVKRVWVDPSVSVQFDVPIVFDRLTGQVAIYKPHRLQQVGVEMQWPLLLVVGFDGNNGGVVERTEQGDFGAGGLKGGEKKGGGGGEWFANEGITKDGGRERGTVRVDRGGVGSEDGGLQFLSDGSSGVKGGVKRKVD